MNIEKFEKTLREGIEKFKAGGGTLIYGSFTRKGGACRCPLSATFGFGASDFLAAAAVLETQDALVVWQFVNGFDGNRSDKGTELYELGAKLRAEYQPVHL